MEIIQLILSTLTPIVIVFLGYLLNRRLKLMERESEQRRQQELETKERERNDLERLHKYRLEFSLDARVAGRQKGYYLVEFTATINNKSRLKKDFTAIRLRIRGLEKETAIQLWRARRKNPQTGEVEEQQTNRIYFPVTVCDENILPPFWENIFVEPGVKQLITFSTSIPENISYILATAGFYYTNVPKPHTAEKMFALKQRNEPAV